MNVSFMQIAALWRRLLRQRPLWSAATISDSSFSLIGFESASYHIEKRRVVIARVCLVNPTYPSSAARAFCPAAVIIM
jgi:hypothetical protein